MQKGMEFFDGAPDQSEAVNVRPLGMSIVQGTSAPVATEIVIEPEQMTPKQEGSPIGFIVILVVLSTLTYLMFRK
jgi:hypothetical protein